MLTLALGLGIFVQRQNAVTTWGTEQGVGVRQLRALGLYPVQPPRFGDTSRLTGQRFY